MFDFTIPAGANPLASESDLFDFARSGGPTLPRDFPFESPGEQTGSVVLAFPHERTTISGTPNAGEVIAFPIINPKNHPVWRVEPKRLRSILWCVERDIRREVWELRL